MFLAGNGLPGRFRDGFHIAELGFGTGLNLLATLAAHSGPGHLHYTSFEAFPMPSPDIARALSAFPELDAIAQPLLRQWATGATGLAVSEPYGTVILGDARDTLPAGTRWRMPGSWMAFRPRRTPSFGQRTCWPKSPATPRRAGRFATYTAAGHVRRSLAEAGFSVTRQPGYGRKRHMTAGKLGG